MAGIPNGYIFPPPRSFTPGVWQGPPNFCHSGPHMSHESLRPPPPPVGTGNGFLYEPGPNFNMHMSQAPMIRGYQVSGHQPPFANFNQRQRFHGNRVNQGRGLVKMNTGIQNGSIENKEQMMFSCQPCEKQFKTLADKTMHLKGHSKCEVEGCEFIASRKALKLHFVQVHEEGKFRIVLQSESDIKKWKQERRKNYPCLLRKKMQIEHDEEKKRKGNVLETKLYSYRGNDSWHIKNQKTKRKETGREEKEGLEETNPVKSDTKEQIEFKIKVEPANEEENDQVAETVKSKPNAIKSLQLMYDSSSSEDESGNVPEKAVSGTMQANGFDGHSSNRDAGDKREENVDTNRASFANQNSFHQGSAGKDTHSSNNNDEQYFNGAKKLSAEDLQNGSKQNQHWDRSREVGQNKRPLQQKRNFTNRDSQAKRPRKPTLLEMLLAKDIRHERNIILQCIRHIVQNDFFDCSRADKYKHSV